MLNFLIGENASGKTRYLRDLLHNCKSDLFVTNLPDEICRSDYKTIDGIVSWLEDETTSEIFERDGVFAFLDLPFSFSDKFNSILRLMSRDVDYMFLDEPDEGLSKQERSMLSELFIFLSRTDKQIWVSTHDSAVLYYDNSRYFLVDKGNAVELSGDEAVEYLI